MRMTSYKILFAFLIAFIPNKQIYAFDLDSAMKIVEAKYATVNDYTCNFSKEEYHDGEYVQWKNVIFKYRKPDNYYIKWTEGSMEGTEIIYAGKKYNYKMKGHLGGILNLLNFDIDPLGSIAMRNSRHSIFESSIGFLIKLMKDNIKEAKNQNTGKIEFIKIVKLNNRVAELYKAEFPVDKGFYGHIIYIYLDNLLNLPVKLVVYDWNKNLTESFIISNLKINVGLKDIDFDAENNSYEF